MMLLDTGPLVAALDRRESHHRWAITIFEGLREPLLTCGAVLSETSFLLDQHPPAVARWRGLVRDGVIRPAVEDAPLWNRALALMEHYANVPMALADACLGARAEATPGARLFTLDRCCYPFVSEANRRSNSPVVGALYCCRFRKPRRSSS